MKGVILAGGTGSRLYPLTKVTNKHLLPVYNKPMIYYPLQTMISAGIKEILIISGPGHAGHFVNLLGSGKDFNVKISYEIQDEAGGIAQALSLADDFADDENIMVVLGDNIIEDNLKHEAENFDEGAKIFIKQVQDPKRFGVPYLDGDKVLSIEEKPEQPKSDYAVTGVYMYDKDVFRIIKNLKPSARNELEITDVNNAYIRLGKMVSCRLKGFWSDAGTFGSLYRASTLVRDKELKEKIR